MSLTDKMTGTLQKMMKAMNSTVRAMEQMHTASNRVGDMRSLQRARRDIESASASFERLRSSARLAGNEGQNSGNRIRNGLNGVRESANSATSSVRSLISSLMGFTAAYLSIQGISNGFNKFTQASDNYSNTNARLANINDRLQTQKELQDKIYRASQRSLSSYNDTASSVAKLNLLAKDAFASNDEALRFTELMNKSFSVSGAGTQEKQAGMYQLTQAMASGRLQGDEFRSIMENAPLLGQAIADATGVGMEGLKDMSSDGEITADIIKKSLFAAATEIEDKFNKMPLTFADAMTVFNNWAQRAFEPLFVRFRQFVNSNAFGILAGHAMVFVNLFVSGLSFVFSILEALYNMIGAVGQFMYDNANWVVPILVILGTVIGSIVAILVAKYAILGLIRVATLAWAAAQWVVNAAFLSNPITWILIGIIAVIALVITAMIMWAEQSAAVVGAIVGSVYWLGAVIYNVLMGIGNFGIMVAEWFVNTWNQGIFLVQLAWIALNLLVRMIFDSIGNAALRVAEFFLNKWNEAVFGVQMAFYFMQKGILTVMSGVASGIVGAVNHALGAVSTLINGAVKGINTLIGLINKIPGVDISNLGEVDLKASTAAVDKLNSIKSELEMPTKAAPVNLGSFNTAGAYMQSVEMPKAPQQASFSRLEYKNLGDAYTKGNEVGQEFSMAASEKLGGLVDKAKGLVGLGKDDKNKSNPFIDKASLMDDVVKTAPSESGLGAAGDPDKGKLKGGKLDKVKKIEDKINLADEYLEVFKDIAEGKAINNIISLTPNLQVHNNFEDTTGSKMEKLLNKYDDLSRVGGKSGEINDLVSNTLNAPARDDIAVSKDVREKVSSTPITNSNKTIVQHVKSEPKIEFSGDIHKDVDLNELVKLITKWLKDEQDRSVEGVYE